MSGVIREILESEGGSMSGEEDFFSVARTMPLVAVLMLMSLLLEMGGAGTACRRLTFDAQGCHTLINCIQCIF